MRRMVIIGIILSAVAGCGESTTGPGTGGMIDLTVYVANEDGTPVQRARVSTIPPTGEVTTDDAGRGTFFGIVSQPYFFVIEPPGRPVYQYYKTLEGADTDSLLLTVITEPPDADILFPRTGNIVSTESASFSGAAIDHEDGPLPDSLMVWQLDNAGEIGRGGNIDIAGLSPGSHTITFTAYDSDGKSSSEMITVTAEPFSLSSYFPLVNGAEWSYNHQPAAFNMYNHQQILERWSLDNVSVEIDDAGRRISTITYRATVFSNVRHYRYQVIDELHETGTGVEITRTTEEMSIWLNTMSGQPDEYLRIETGYDPAYPLLADLTAPGEGGARAFTCSATVKWTYIGITEGTTSFVETPIVSGTISTGEPETTMIDGKSFETVPVTITDGDSQRKWWLAKGFGITKFQYNTFDANPVATVVGTNLASDYAAPLFNKAAVAQPADIGTPGGIPESEFEYIRTVRNVMRTAVP